MWQTFLDWDRRLRRRFYDGPALFSYPGRRIQGYRSPNLLMAFWLHAAAVSWMTPPGRILFLVTGALFLAGMTAVLMPMYFLSFTLTSLFIVDFSIGWLRRPKLRVIRRVPSPAPANYPVRVEYQVRNLHHRPAWHLSVDSIPQPGQLYYPEGRLAIPHLAPGAEVTLHNVMIAPRRGRYDLSLPVVDSSFPFGLWRWGCRGEPNRPLLVYPAYLPLRHMHLPTGFRFLPGGSASTASANDSMEFLGTREYRYGDNFRHIHALSSARRGTPVIKEFREEQLCRTVLLVDNFVRPLHGLLTAMKRENEQFEALLTLAAATADYLIRQNFEVDFMVPGANDTRLEGQAGPLQLQQILEAIACLSDNQMEAFHGPSPENQREVARVGAAVLIMLDWDAARLTVVQRLRDLGVALKIIIVTARPVALPPGEDAVSIVKPQDLRAGVVSEI